MFNTGREGGYSVFIAMEKYYAESVYSVSQTETFLTFSEYVSTSICTNHMCIQYVCFRCAHE